MDSIKIPRGIDDPPQVLLWSIDELLPFMAMLILGALMRQLAACALASLVLIKLFRRFRDSRPDGYLYHRLYWAGLTPLKDYSLINPYRRHFLP